MKKRQLLCMTLSAALLLSACGGPSSTTKTSSGEDVGDSYPLKSEETLTYWMTLDASVSATNKSFGETEFAKELEKRTGVKVEYIHPTSAEQFNLMLASENLPDIIEYYWTRYPGGGAKAIEDGHIIALNDLMKAHSPAILEYYKTYPQVSKLAATYEGLYYSYPSLSKDGGYNVTAGPIFREDWLNELGIAPPETIDDWTNALMAFRDQKGAESPLSFANFYNFLSWGAITGAYGVVKGLYVDGDTIKYGSVEPAYKDFLIQMNQWYKEGLLDKNFATTDIKALDSNILQDKSGATFASIGSGIGKWMGSSAKSDSFSLIGVQYPTMAKGERQKFTQIGWAVSGTGAAISSACKNPQLAAKFLDYGYTEEGEVYFNFGQENVSYSMKEGKPVYTDLIMNNPDGLPINHAMGKYIRGHISGANLSDIEYFRQYANLPQQQQANAIWMDSDTTDNSLPPFPVKPEASTQAAKLTNEIKTYEEESLVRFIMGITPIEEFDNYVAQMKSFGLDEIISIYQEAYDNYRK